MQVENKRIGVWFVLMAAVLWGTTGTSQAFAPAGFDSMVIGALRLAIGGGAMLLLVLLRSGMSQLRGWPLKVTFAAAAFTALYQLCFFAGVAKTGVAVGTIVGIGSAPVAGGALGYLFRGERPGRPWFAATALAIVGCIVLTLSSGGDVRIDPLGVALAIGAGIAYAAYTLVIKGLLDTHEPDAVIAVIFCIGALMLAPLLVGRDMAWLAAPRSIAVVLHLGLVTAALAYWFFVRGLRRVPVATAVTLSLAEPLTAGLLGFLVLGEQLNPLSFAGIALIFSGLAVLTCAGRAAPESSAKFGG
ncbi:MAG: DMT family transporter [Desulfuromonadales bacterium]